VRLAGSGDEATRSPALHRQELLHETFVGLGERLGEPQKWSQRRTLTFIGLTCGGFWTCVAVGVAHLLRQG
jgi:hypothetical protein